MKSLKNWIDWAEQKKVAIGHFNVSDSEGYRAVVEVAKELDLPVVIGASEGEREFIGTEELAALVRLEKEKGLPIFLNADHCYSFETVKSAVDAGFDSVIIDGASLAYEENVLLTRRCVEYAKSVNPEILVEAEMGFIGKSSKLLEKIPDGVSEETQTNPEEAKIFVQETGVDLLAPSVGNIHGMVRSGNPRLNIERVRAVRETSGVPLVLHGGSGISDEDFVLAIDAGISIIHINTELRAAYKEGIKSGLANDDVAPYKFMAQGVEEMKKVVSTKLKLFNKI
jgi:fructose-bisphosphate aldolase, class II